MRIGYCSPFNPMKSGVSDFSEELVCALSKYVDIVVFSPVEIESVLFRDNFDIRPLSDLDNEAIRGTLDVIVYHMGNNITYHGEVLEKALKYQGIVEVHDYGMHHLAAEKYYIREGAETYLRMAEYCHGRRGRHIASTFLQGLAGAPWETHSLDMPMNRYVLENAIGVITHSEAAKQMILGEFPKMPIKSIMLHTELIDDTVTYKEECRKKIGVAKNTIVCGSFGFATREKRIIPTLDALCRIREKEKYQILYLIVGEPQKELSLEKAIKERNLESQVRITGFTSLEDFKIYMGACDFCLNLRYPTQGESSASLHRMFGMGKPAIVTDIGTFSDYPDSVVRKVGYGEKEVDEIYEAICEFASNRAELKKRSEAAIAFAKQYCDIDKNAQAYASFFQKIIDNSWQSEYEDTIITKICELVLTDDDYLRHVWDATDGLLNT